jgi:hypothetical protein
VKREETLQQAASLDSSLSAIQEDTEKRRHARVPVSVGVEIIDPQTHMRIAGRVTDFGVGGCYVDTITTFPKGTLVDMFLHWQEQKLHLRALVSYIATGRSIGMGLAFTGASAEAGTTILDWLTGMSNEPQGIEPSHKTVASPRGQTARDGRTQLDDIVGELVEVLTNKKLLTEIESAEFRRKLLRIGEGSS